MNLKWIGGIIILLGCGGFGFCLAAANRRQIRELRELSAILDVSWQPDTAAAALQGYFAVYMPNWNVRSHRMPDAA